MTDLSILWQPFKYDARNGNLYQAPDSSWISWAILFQFEVPRVLIDHHGVALHCRLTWDSDITDDSLMIVRERIDAR